jgi:hypothetical protein
MSAAKVAYWNTKEHIAEVIELKDDLNKEIQKNVLTCIIRPIVDVLN